jgi:polyisoprenoid-binding protein YceI
MKNLKSLVLAIAVLTTATISAQTKKVDASGSKIAWVGKKVTGKHEGTISIKEGSLVFKKNMLAGGTVVVDMSSIIVTDLESGKGKESLEGHLKDNDFFGTEKFPTAKIVFKSIGVKSKGVYAVTADLTIKGITNPVKFDLTTTANSAIANVVVDRTKYDIKYNSGNFFQNLGDKTISDDFDLAVSLKF